MIWTDTLDARLKSLRDANASWSDIANTLGTTAESARKRYQRFSSSVAKPTGWQPGIEFDGERGTIVSRPSEGKPDWDDLIRTWGFDPAEVEVIEPVQVRTWDVATADGIQTMRYHKANLRKRSRDVSVDVEPLLREVARHKRHKPAGNTEKPRALVVALSDWQLGKGGTAQAVDRVLGSIDLVQTHLRGLLRGGRPATEIAVVGLGDIVEQCDGHYPMQAFDAELDRRSQERLARQLILKWVTTLAPLTDRMVVAAIGGNHGENRKDGKAYTSFGDNSDVAVFESVAEIVRFNPDAYSHVEFVIPQDELTMVLDICGTKVGLAHGHQFGSGPAPVAAQKWWQGQAFGQQVVGDASILVTGHRHHFAVVEEGGRVWIQAPTQDSGSPWFTQVSGRPSRPGQLVFTVDENGWCGDATVLR